MSEKLFEKFKELGFFKNRLHINKIMAQFENFPDKKYLNLSIFQIDLFEFKECDDYRYLINRLGYISGLEFKVECIKSNKIELFYNNKKYKKSFRVNGSRFDTDNLLDFLNNKVLKGNDNKFFLLAGDSHILYPIYEDKKLVEKAKELSIIATE